MAAGFAQRKLAFLREAPTMLPRGKANVVQPKASATTAAGTVSPGRQTECETFPSTPDCFRNRKKVRSPVVSQILLMLPN